MPCFAHFPIFSNVWLGFANSWDTVGRVVSSYTRVRGFKSWHNPFVLNIPRYIYFELFRNDKNKEEKEHILILTSSFHFCLSKYNLAKILLTLVCPLNALSLSIFCLTHSEACCFVVLFVCKSALKLILNDSLPICLFYSALSFPL